MTNKIHPLRAWRDKQEPRVSARRFCSMLDEVAGGSVVSHASLTRIEQGLQPASYQLMRLAEQITGGDVTPNDFVAHGPQ